MHTVTIPTAKVFHPLLGKARYLGTHGGRGSGKSHFCASAVVEQSLSNHGLRILCVREIQRTLKESSKLLLEDEIRRLHVGRYFDIKEPHITGPGNGLIAFTGLQSHTAESIKSLEGFNLCWVDEAHMLSERSLELLRPTIRAPGSSFLFSWNPRSADDPIDRLLRGSATPKDAIVVEANYHDNPFFPAELEEERRHDEIHNPTRYAHIWQGAYESDDADAIWKWQWINGNRTSADRLPVLGRTVVAVDHAISEGGAANEHGIIAAAIGNDGRAYVLEDASIKGTPEKWARQTIALYDKYDADALIIERNQGGDLVRNTLRTIRPFGLSIVEVTATRGKHLRAEPIAAAYALGKVSHVGTWPELEKQMCQMTTAGYVGKGSPDRCDALVYSLTEILPRVGKPLQVVKDVVLHNTGAQSWMG